MMIDSTEYPLAFRTEAASVEREFDHLATQYILPPIFLCSFAGGTLERQRTSFLTWTTVRKSLYLVPMFKNLRYQCRRRRRWVQKTLPSINFCCFENFKKIKKIKKTEGFSGTDSAAWSRRSCTRALQQNIRFRERPPRWRLAGKRGPAGPRSER